MSDKKSNELTLEALDTWAANATPKQLVEWQQRLEAARIKKRDAAFDRVLTGMAEVFEAEDVLPSEFNWANISVRVKTRIINLKGEEAS